MNLKIQTNTFLELEEISMKPSEASNKVVTHTCHHQTHCLHLLSQHL